MQLTEKMLAYLDATKEETLCLLRELSVIPAPSGQETLRAQFVKDWLIKNGFENVTIDSAGNVLAPYCVTDENDVLVVSAHTDVVFPDTEPLPLEEDDEIIRCPGITDDTGNLVSMLLAARYFVQNRLTPECGIVFAANTCEEGLGNLRGIRAICEQYGARMRAHITFDGTNLHRMVTGAVGSHRYRVTVRTQGGHSFTHFGRPSAVCVLGQMIEKIYKLPVPEKENTKTTYNVGTICGGTSVNSIAQEAQMLCEYRSDDRECLAQMEQAFASIFEQARTPEISVAVERVGDRPCSGEIDAAAFRAFTDRLDGVIVEQTGLAPLHASDSTDANVPLSLGIPAVCLSATRGRGAHTREEYVIKNELPDSSRFAMRVLAEFFSE